MENKKSSACKERKPPGSSGSNRLDKTSTYQVGGKTFVVEPVFRQDGKETIGTILVNLMRTDINQT